MSSSAAESAVIAGSSVGRFERRLRLLAWVLFALTIAELAMGTALDFASGRGLTGPVYVVFLAFPIVGVILATRRPHNPLGWLMLVATLGFAFPGESYAGFATSPGHLDPAGAALALAIGTPMWVPFIGLSGFMLLLFPDGHLPSPRWRWFAWLCGIGLVALFLAVMFSPGNFSDSGFPHIQNPLGFQALTALLGPLLVSVVFAPLIVAGGAVGLIVRRRGSTDPVEREQIRWVTWGAAVIAVTYIFAFIPGIMGISGWGSWLGNIAVATFMLIPVTIGIAVLKYRLYDIDVVIRKTVLYAILALLILIVSFTLVWLTSRVFTSTFEGRRLDLVAGVTIGLLFWPLRRVATRISDRVVFGGRSTPYEVLSEFGDRLAGTYSSDDVLQRTARVMGEGVGAELARVWLGVGDDLQPVAMWSRDGADPDRPDDLRMDVRHQGELLGALSVVMPSNDPMDASKEKLVADLAAQAGLLLRNVGLLEEIKASRRRLVTAQDEERRRLERNIHDGAQQQLVALAIKARLARQLTERDPAKVGEMLEQIGNETQQALEDLRDLARGIYPPLLADKGLVVAIEAQGRRSPVPVTVTSELTDRFSRDVEAAVYFCVLEALQNVAKYAAARAITVTLARGDGGLWFTVADDGRGFDPSAIGYGTGLQGIADRLGALDGSLNVVSAPGAGTTVTGHVPAFAFPQETADIAPPTADPLALDEVAR